MRTLKLMSRDKGECIVMELPKKEVVQTGRRTKLPMEIHPKEGYNIWEIIKPNLGKDFSRFSVPITYNEPLSMLQRLCESYMGYIDLVAEACRRENPVERMELITAYAISGLAANRNRLSKPFNPLLLETFEYEKDDARFHAEQVSHHPPVSAFHVDGDGYTACGTVSPKVSFWMNRLICSPHGVVRLTLKRHRETYAWETPDCSIYNVMLGKMYMNITGAMIIRSSSALETRLSFDGGAGWRIRTTDVHVDGHIIQGREKIRAIYGNWSHFLASCCPKVFKDGYSSYQKAFVDLLDVDDRVPLLSGSTILWVANKNPEKHEMQYHFTYMTLALNEPPDDELRNALPPTDTRLRPDIQKLEQGKIDEATRHKELLENAQRVRRAQGTGKTPHWFRFTKDTIGRGETWLTTGTYWNRQYEESEQIFETTSPSLIIDRTQPGSVEIN